MVNAAETDLLTAHNEWRYRPADQRFESLDALYDATRHHFDQAAQADLDISLVRAVDQAGAVQIVGPSGVPAALTNWSFGQLANRAKAPAGYLRTLPAPLVAQAINYGLDSTYVDDRQCSALFTRGDDLTCRAFTSDRYSRIWDFEIVERLRFLQAELGWRVPPARPATDDQPGARPATAADILPNQGDFGLRVKIGDIIAPAGLYASAQDMFAFMVNENARIEDGSPNGLAHGFFVSNSEVGAAAFKLTRFLYRHVCGNHIVWGASDVKELRIVHVGSADQRFTDQVIAELSEYSAESAETDERRIMSCNALFSRP